MRWRLLLLGSWRRHPWLVATLCAMALGAVLLPLASDSPEKDDRPPRLLIGRVWFDHAPASSRDDVDLWLFAGSGYGVYQKGSFYRGSYDVFEFERSGGSIALSWLHDDKRARTKFDVRRCDDAPAPFDLCLTLHDSPRGPKTYYSFDDPDEAAEHYPELRLSVR